MYREKAPSSCPACGASLVTLKSTQPIDGCGVCGGVWLGPEATVHVLRGLGDELEREIARASRAVEASARAPVLDEGARACPTCGQTMGRLAVGKTVVDSCPAHGAWFDRTEVASVIAMCGELRQEQRVDEAPAEPAQYHTAPREGGSDGTATLLQVVVRALVAFVER